MYTGSKDVGQSPGEVIWYDDLGSSPEFEETIAALRDLDERIGEFAAGRKTNWEWLAEMARTLLEKAKHQRQELQDKLEQEFLKEQHEDVTVSDSATTASSTWKWKQRALQLSIDLAECHAGANALSRQIKFLQEERRASNNHNHKESSRRLPNVFGLRQRSPVGALPQNQGDTVTNAVQKGKERKPSPPQGPQQDMDEPNMSSGEGDGESSHYAQFAEGNLAMALEGSGIYIAHLDSDLRYTFVYNPPYGMAGKEMLGKNVESMLPPEYPGVSENAKLKAETLKTGRTMKKELTMLFPGLGPMTWATTCRPKFDASNNVVGVCVTAVDVTEQVQAREVVNRLKAEMQVQQNTEKELRRAVRLSLEATAAKSAFVAVMSHEIRTPLNGLLGLAQLLLHTPLSEEQKELVEKLLQSGDVLLSLADDILSLSKAESGQLVLRLRPFSPRELARQMHDTFQPVAARKSVALNLHIADSVAHEVEGDVLRLRQVLTNLIENAIKFTDSGSVNVRMLISTNCPFIEPSPHIRLPTPQGGASSCNRTPPSPPAGDTGGGVLPSCFHLREELLALLENTKRPPAVTPDETPRAGDQQGEDKSEGRSDEEQTAVTAMEEMPGKDADKKAGSGEEIKTEETEPAACQEVWLCVEVADTGIGIPKWAMATLFDKFMQVNASTTRRNGGTGLGLAISKELVELMGGHLSVQSIEGLGSTFSFAVRCHLPHSPKCPPPLSKESQHSPASPVPTIVPFLHPLYAEEKGKMVDQGPSSSTLSSPLSDISPLPSIRLGKSTQDYLLEHNQTRLGRHVSSVQSLAPSPPGNDWEEQHVAGSVASSAAGSSPAPAGRLSTKAGKALKGNLRTVANADCATSSLVVPLVMEDPKLSGPMPRGQEDKIPVINQQEQTQAPPEQQLQPGGGAVCGQQVVDGSGTNERHRDLRILVVDDVAVNQMVLQGMLARLLGPKSQAGLTWTSDVAGDGWAALAAMQAVQYDLVLMDVCMPNLDGLQTTQLVREFEASGTWPPLPPLPAGTSGGRGGPPTVMTKSSQENLQAVAAAEADGRKRKWNAISAGTDPLLTAGLGPLPPGLAPAGGLVGNEGLFQSKQTLKRIPIVAVTANAFADDVERCKASGMDNVVAKPVNFQKLREVLDLYLPLEAEGKKERATGNIGNLV